MKELAEHSFVKLLMEQTKSLIEKSSIDELTQTMRLKMFGKYDHQQSQKIIHFPYEAYSAEVFFKTSSILFCIDRLKMCLVFIKQFPRPKFYKKHDINRYKWIHYHYSYYTITIVSIFDTILQLINAVYQIGLHERDCTKKIIFSNKWLVGTLVLKELSKVDKLIQIHRNKRNLHIHRGEELQITDILETDIIEVINWVEFVQEHSETYVEPELLKLIYEGEIEKIVSRLRDEIDLIVNGVWSLFSELQHIYFDKNKDMAEESLKLAQAELARRKSN